MGENGFLPGTLLGIRKEWDDRHDFVQDSYGQEWVSQKIRSGGYKLGPVGRAAFKKIKALMLRNVNLPFYSEILTVSFSVCSYFREGHYLVLPLTIAIPTNSH